MYPRCCEHTRRAGWPLPRQPPSKACCAVSTSQWVAHALPHVWAAQEHGHSVGQLCREALRGSLERRSCVRMPAERSDACNNPSCPRTSEQLLRCARCKLGYCSRSCQQAVRALYLFHFHGGFIAACMQVRQTSSNMAAGQTQARAVPQDWPAHKGMCKARAQCRAEAK